MHARDEFDAWAAEGRDRGMEERHWRTAKQALSRMPIEPGDTVLDLGCGSGYAARAMVGLREAGRAIGIDGAPRMVENARTYTRESPAVDGDNLEFCTADFESLPLPDNGIDHAFSMEAIYYAGDVTEALSEVRRVLGPGGTFYCAVDYYEENQYSHDWDELVEAPMTLLSKADYRERFREAGFHVAEQDNLTDRETEIPPEAEFPTDDFQTREQMVERYRTLGTLLTVGVVP